MVTITESELRRICVGLKGDREKIVRFNPIGTPDETMLWMLLSCLISYLSISDDEAPCFTGVPDETTYRNAIGFVLRDRRESDFAVDPILDDLLEI